MSRTAFGREVLRGAQRRCVGSRVRTPTYSLVKRPWRGFWSYRRTPVHLSRRLVRSSVHSLWDRWSLSPARLYDASLWVASAGAVETTLLTLWKVLRSEVTCAVRGCSDVLSSPYASFFGIPLTFFGAVTYSLLAFFTLQARREREAKARSMQTAGVMTSSGTTLQGNHDSDSIAFRLLRLRIRIEGICLPGFDVRRCNVYICFQWLFGLVAGFRVTGSLSVVHFLCSEQHDSLSDLMCIGELVGAYRPTTKVDTTSLGCRLLRRAIALQRGGIVCGGAVEHALGYGRSAKRTPCPIAD
ncbi:hypothetical protein F1559_002452 [Cyanidiococcus yangmingshanensis]|uniref:Vitamin K epoxide reductase domain-containing protein n=1 Tax=Cyanidiococcus yangmingshanensis TaxID=2690220 RepID=A0A7J7IP86_9RHOD|nr:hypothetical protein F1559_002452 [Cyanidiococcus yangmingshanensis]